MSRLDTRTARHVRPKQKLKLKVLVHASDAELGLGAPRVDKIT